MMNVQNVGNVFPISSCGPFCTVHISIISKLKNPLCAFFISMSFVAGMDLTMEINKGIRPLPGVTSLLYLIKKQVSLCYTLYHTHTQKQSVTCCHQGRKRKHLFLWEPGPLMMQANHTHAHTKSHTIVFCIIVTRLITSQSFNGGCVYLRESPPCVCVCVYLCVYKRERECVCGCQIPDQMAKCQ